jgi:TM2 domain-containing membrane protein YozV
MTGAPAARGDVRAGGRGSAAPIWIKAYLLWFFLGIFGAHRLYLKRTLSGNLYLATLGLFGLGWLADAVLTGFMVRGRLAELDRGQASFEREALAEIESLEFGLHARAPMDEAEPDPAFEVLDFVASTALFVLSSAALAYIFIYYDLALMSFPIAVVWIVLLMDVRRVDALKDTFFIIKDLPVNVENTLSATVFKNFHFRKGYRISAGKYLAYPLYILAYPFLGRKLDRGRGELKELFMFFRLYTGIFLFWLTIGLSRYFSQTASLGHSALTSLLCLHPFGLALGLWRGWYPAQYMAGFYPASAALLALVAYFAQVSNSLIVRNQYDMTVSRAERSFAPAFRVIIVTLIAAFALLGFGAMFSSPMRSFLEGLSPVRFRNAADYAYRPEALKGLLEEHIFSAENQGVVYELLESSVVLAGEGGRDYSRGTQWLARRSAYEKAFLYDLERFCDQRFRSYYNFYPILFDDREGLRHCYLVYTVDDTAQVLSALGKRRIYPLALMEAVAQPDEPTEGSTAAERGRAFSVRILLPESYRSDGDLDPLKGEAERLEADIGNKVFLDELSEGFRRYFIDQGLDVDSFEIRLDRFLAEAKGRI